jgi:hypothetical protein
MDLPQLPASRTRATFIACALCLAAILYLDAAVVSGQSKATNAQLPTGIETVPIENRARLFERIKAYVRAGRDRDWSTQYDLMAAEMNVNESREAFISRHRREAKDGMLFELLDIETSDISVLMAATDRTAGSWIVSGCARYHEQYTIGNPSYETTIELRLRDKEWFIAGAGPLGQIDGPLDSCRFHKQRGILAQK